ncbi:MAG: 6-phosphogluconolactonase [Gammaproteobacteria bacterium]|nr:6-phosphogluconolactonase [Gammaproteobacteria bacterium]
MGTKTHIYQAPETLFRQCARRILELATRTLQTQDYFHIALAGGTTPRALYQQLSRLHSEEFPHWDRVRFYFGDERNVPPDHQQSNYRMVRESLFQPLQIKDSAIQRIRGELSPEEAVSHYRQALEQLPQENGTARFDLVLLGIGADGHIASLFPNTPLLQEQQQGIGASYVDKLECWRYSLTLPVLNNARHIIMLVSGAKKADVVRHVFHGPGTAEPLPVQMLDHDKVEWYLDADAARFLDEECEA